MMIRLKQFLLLIIFLHFSVLSFAQKMGTDVSAPLHLLKPDYKTPYGAPAIDSVKKVLDKVYNYLEANKCCI